MTACCLCVGVRALQVLVGDAFSNILLGAVLKRGCHGNDVCSLVNYHMTLLVHVMFMEVCMCVLWLYCCVHVVSTSVHTKVCSRSLCIRK